MSVELVTGYSGVGSGGEPNRHVSSAEDGARQAGTLGLGSYVLSTGSKLSATMEDANTLVVADGDVVMNGRHVSLPDATSFTIPTGVQGQKVSNIAVLRYSKAADSVESVTPLVLTGKPSTGEPTDPAHNDGSILDGDSPVDMPLYRVVTDGINAGDPEPLFDIMLPMAELSAEIAEVRDSVSRTKVFGNAYPAAADYWIFASAYYCPSGVVIGGNFSPGQVVSKGGILCWIDLPRDANIESNMLIRGAFPNHQSGARVELSGRRLTVSLEQETTFETQDTFNFMVPLKWA